MIEYAPRAQPSPLPKAAKVIPLMVTEANEVMIEEDPPVAAVAKPLAEPLELTGGPAPRSSKAADKTRRKSPKRSKPAEALDDAVALLLDI
jgi:hypothetical protein